MITYKPLKTMEEMENVSEVESKVWGMSPIPTHQTATAIKNGGIVIGAYDEQNLIGFSYGFAGFNNQKASLCSHMLGILPDYRSGGIGEKLKLKQKEEALKIGYDLMTWTYDPLQTRNAYLNLSKLHGVCNTYIPDCYGKMSDELNDGLPSDRFQIDWWIDSAYVNDFSRTLYKEPQLLDTWHINEAGLPALDGHFSATQTLSELAYYVPVPNNIGELKAKNMELALDWRYKTRAMFEEAFAQGYAAIELHKASDAAVYYYLLVQKNTLKIPQ